MQKFLIRNTGIQSHKTSFIGIASSGNLEDSEVFLNKSLNPYYYDFTIASIGIRWKFEN